MPNKAQRCAGAIWLLMGSMLLLRGCRYLRQAQEAGAPRRAICLALALGVAAGIAKGRLVLTKTARGNQLRLENLPDARPWQIFAPSFYPLLMLMMGISIGLRKLFQTGFAGGMVAYGGIVLGVGSGLCVSSLPYFQAVRR
mmetsp:Transcript_55228/g.131862  ORF Transcript_55228/g.131862 Transcript_55228/m.131862 type:complete len:141 (+) Transcript_55228:2-424(+)